jgi:AraC family transcriptional regulator, positive regulator of tynA and feaB
MKLVFSTDHVCSRNAFDYWHSVACKHIVLHDAMPEHRDGFQAELRSERLSDVTIVEFHNSPMDISHDRQHIGRATGREVFVCLQTVGSVRLEQIGRDVLLNTGDMTLLDPLRAYRGKFFAGSRMLVLKVPRQLLEMRVGKVENVVAMRLAVEHSETRLTSLFLGLLPAHAGELRMPAAPMVASQALDLIAVSIARTMESGPARLSSARSFVRFRLHVVIEARLSDRSLNPADAAAAAGVSIRYANAVLSDEGLSIGELIQSRRLTRCREALADTQQSHRSRRSPWAGGSPT